LVTIGSGVCEGAGVEFPTFPLTCVVVLKTLWHYRASVWSFCVLLNDVSMTSSCSWNSAASESRNMGLHFSRLVASKQSRSQSRWLWDLGCDAASCLQDENSHHRRTEAAADWSLMRPWTVDCWVGYWAVAWKT